MGVQIDKDGARTLPQISGGRVAIPLWVSVDGTTQRYTGNDFSMASTIYIYDDAKGGGDVLAGGNFTMITYSKGSATKAWKDGYTEKR